MKPSRWIHDADLKTDACREDRRRLLEVGSGIYRSGPGPEKTAAYELYRRRHECPDAGSHRLEQRCSGCETIGPAPK